VPNSARRPCAPCSCSFQETDAWLTTLFELIPLLDKTVLKAEVLSLALSKGDVEGVVGSKTICVRILGALAPRLVRGAGHGGCAPGPQQRLAELAVPLATA
jgi:hypothetical protein